VLDTGDGAAIAFLGDPEDALSAGIAVRKSIASLPPEILSARMGINLGPVRLVWDINAQMNILGDGINVAQRVMSFAMPGQLLASRSFYEVVSRLSRDYASLFSDLGTRTDKHVREHECMRLPRAPGSSARPTRRGAARARAPPIPTKPTSTFFHRGFTHRRARRQESAPRKKAARRRPRSSRPEQT